MIHTSSTINSIAHSGMALAGVVLVVVVVNKGSGAP
jgi:hypothetical protein